jgi:alpha-amylase
MRVLSLFDCNLNSIKGSLKEVKEQGFNAVQISPLQNTKDDYSNEWWMLYQPINFNLGNRIGSIDDLKRLCEEARKLNLYIVADVVINHLAATDEYNSLNPNPKCDRDILYCGDCWKEKRNISNWNSRYETTHYCMGLPGLNPNNKIVQEKIINMLNQYIDYGVEGFRFDAAKSIALPEEGCDFFKNVTYSLKRWLPVIYGEVLFADKDLIQKYAKYMKVLTNSDAYNNDDVIKFVENKDSYLSSGLSYTRNTPIWEINNWYSNIAQYYPNTLYYARNYSWDWHAWKSKEVKNANLKLVKR